MELIFCVVLCLGFVTCWLLLSSVWFAVFSLFSNSLGSWFVHFSSLKFLFLNSHFFLSFVLPFLSPSAGEEVSWMETLVLFGVNPLCHSSDTRYKRCWWCQNLENPSICLFHGEQFILQSYLRTKPIFGYSVMSFILLVKVANTFALYYGHLFE